MVRIVVSSATLAVLLSAPTQAFVPLSLSTPSTTSALFATTNSEEGILLAKKGLQWVMVPPANAAEFRAADSLMNKVGVAPPDAPVVDAAAKVATSAPPTSVAASISESVSVSVPVATYDSPILKIVPKTTDALAARSSSEAVNAFREGYWSHMPHYVPPPAAAVSSGQPAPLITDLVKERSGEFLQSYGPTVSHFVKTQAETLDGQMKMAASQTIPSNAQAVAAKWSVAKEYLAQVSASSAEITKQNMASLPSPAETLHVAPISVDPSVFVSLKDKLQSVETKSISLEELKDLFNLDSLQSTLAASSAGAAAKMSVISSSWNEFASSVESVKLAMNQQGGGSEALVNAMNLKETGAWYVGAVGLAFVLALSSAAKSGMSAQKQKILLTDAATPGTKAQLPKPDLAAMGIDRDLVNDQVNKLKEATASVYAQLDELKAEKNSRASEVATMKSELRTVMTMLEANILQEQELRQSLADTQEQLKRETSDLRAQLQERLAAEEELRTQLAATQDQLATEMRNVEMAKSQAREEVSAAQAQVKRLEQEKALMEKEMLTLKQELEALLGQLDQQGAPPATLNVNGDATRAAAAAKAATRLPSSYTDLSNAFFAAIAEPNGQAGSKVRGASNAAGNNKRMVKKVVAKKQATDWSSMSLSALKRKTVKELTAYLEQKGAPTTGPDGKTLKKDYLVQNILGQAA